MLKSFLPLFVMTFFICTFIVLMQFLWLHLNDLVGKGLGIDVLGELFFYAALSMVPMALPLAVLLASLMTFGNLGESLELTALKSGGVSLWRVMRPLIVLMALVAVGAFFFQNDVLPIAQTRMWTLLKSMRQKSPELEITEGEFNYQLPNINIYVEHKDRETGMLHKVMIYDMTQGFERSRIIMADSATLVTAPDKVHMYLTLYKGEMFENLRNATGLSHTKRDQLYRREEFHKKEITVSFDANFERMDENDMRSLYIGKNVAQLRHSIDSLNTRLDSIGNAYAKEVASQPLVGVKRTELVGSKIASIKGPVNPDSLRLLQPAASQRRYIMSAQQATDRQRMDYLGRAMYMDDESKVLRRHGIEMHKKFTLSLACLVFFFIGAPLGAIIRKGGLGTPLVISVFLFIFYYIIDNSGTKMARDGKIPVWEGMWLSSGVLLPLGVFVTYKAVHDSAVFNADSYKRLWRTIMATNRRALTVKEVIIEDVDYSRGISEMTQVEDMCTYFLRRWPRPQGYLSYWQGGIPSKSILDLQAALEHAVAHLSNTRDKHLMAQLNDLPILQNFRILHPTRDSRWITLCRWFLPVGLVVWLCALPLEARLIGSVKKTKQLIPKIITTLRDEQNPT